MRNIAFEAGKVGYTEYSRHTGGKSLATDAPLPVWDDLPDAIKYVWEAAANAICMFHEEVKNDYHPNGPAEPVGLSMVPE